MPIVESPYGEVEVPPIPLHTALFAAFAAHAEAGKIAMINGVTGDKYTYGQLLETSKKVGSGLAKLGLKKGDIICLYSPNSPEWVFSFYGAMFAGLTISPVNPAYTKFELEHHLEDCGATYMFTVKELLSQAQEVIKDIPHIKKIIVMNGAAPNTIPLQTLMNDDGSLIDKLEEYEYNPKEDLITLPYSSGTTGLPKGVMITHYNVVAQLVQFGHPNMIDPAQAASGITQVVMAVLPFFHAYGLVGMVMLVPAGGATIVILPRFQPEVFLSAIEKYKVTRLPIVPPIVLFLAKSPMVAKYDLSSVQGISSGAAALSVETEHETIAKTHVPEIRQGWGMTETTVSALLLSATDKARSGSVGKPVPGTQVQIQDPETGKTLGPNQRGELMIRGPQIMKGYLNKPEATKNTITTDGWLHTGDIAYYDEEKYFYIVDRIKELIKVKGFQVPPAELESLLLTHPGVTDVGVIGIPNEESGELPRAFVVKKPGASVSEADIMKFVADRVTSYKHLKGGVVFLSEIPKSPSGKILRRKLRDATMKSKL